MKSIQRTSASFLLRTVFLLCLFLITSLSLRAQLSLSGGVSLGYAVTMTYGNSDDNGTLVNIFGDLQYKRIIGRFQYTGLLPGGFGSSNLNSGYGVHGSLGYSVSISEAFKLPLMATGGFSYISYNTGFNGSSGDTFGDASPQIGFTVSPYYMLNDQISVVGSLRYLNGFEASDRSKAINLTDLALGIRFTF